MTIASLIVDVAANTVSLQQNVEKIHGQLDKVGEMADKLKTRLIQAFTIGAIVKAGQEVIDYAGHVSDLSARLGVSTTTVQQWEAAFGKAGISVDTVAKASDKLSMKLIGGEKSTVTALTKMGLSVQTLLNMKPEDRFLTVADAIGKIQDPAEKSFAAVQAFGKGGTELLAALDGSLGDTIKSFDDMGLIISEDVIKAADDFGDQLGLMGKQLLAVTAAIIGPLLPALSAIGTSLMWVAQHVIGPIFGAAVKGLTLSLGLLWEGLATLLARLADLAQKIPIVGKYLTGLGDASTWLKESAAKTAVGLNAMALGTGKVAEAAEKGKPKLLGLGAAGEDAGKKADKAAESAKKFADSVINLTSASIGAAPGFGMIGKLMGDLSVQAEEHIARLDLLTGSYNEFHGGLTVAGDEMASVTIPLFGQLPNVMAQSTEKIEEATTATGKLVDQNKGLDDLARAFAQLAQIVGGSFGGIVKDIASVIGAMNVGAKAAEGLKASLKVDPETGKRDWGGIVTNVGAIVGAMDQATKSTSRTAATFGGAATGMKIGMQVAGPYGAAIGAAAGALIGFFRSANAVERQVNKTREEFVQAAGGLQALNVKAVAAGVSLDAMLNAKTPAAYTAAINALNAAIEGQQQDVANLNAAIQEYGFSIDELGPAMQRQQLDQQAMKLLDDWRLLVGSGIAIATVNEHMAAKMNDYLQTALRTGTEVPAAMRPMLQTMIDQGLLTDAAGNKIEDLASTGVTFSETMTAGFDRIVKKFDELLARIGAVPGAIAAIPHDTTVHVGYQYDPYQPPAGADNYAASGGIVTATGIQHFGTGGVVLPFRARGSDTVPAMLTPGEMVLTKAQQARLARGGQSTQRLEEKFDQLRREIASAQRALPKQIRDAILLAS